MSLGGRDCGEIVPSVVTVPSHTEYSKLSSPAESAVTMTTGGVALVQPSAGTALPSLVRARAQVRVLSLARHSPSTTTKPDLAPTPDPTPKPDPSPGHKANLRVSEAMRGLRVLV